MTWRSVLVASVLAVFGSAATASAATIEGTLNWNGAVSVDVDTIDWLPLGGGDGVIAVTQPQTGYFAAFGGGIDGAGFPDVTGDSLDLQAPTVFPVVNFLNDFASASASLHPEYSDLSVTLLSLTPSSAAPCVGGEAVNTSCSIGFFTLTQLAGGVSVALTGTGQAIDPTYGNSLVGIMGWSTQGPLTTSTGGTVTTIAGILQEIFVNQGSISASYSGSATFPPDTVVPEPATLLTLGAGTALLAMRRRRKGATPTV